MDKKQIWTAVSVILGVAFVYFWGVHNLTLSILLMGAILCVIILTSIHFKEYFSILGVFVITVILTLGFLFIQTLSVLG
jgi:hypothetical protein